MAAINQIKLNSTSTTYDINDKRISTTAVTTATHFLATDGSVSSIAPITAANAASVLGVSNWYNNETAAGLDSKTTPQTILYWDTSVGVTTVIVNISDNSAPTQIKFTRESLYYRYMWNGTWSEWYAI